MYSELKTFLVLKYKYEETHEYTQSHIDEDHFYYHKHTFLGDETSSEGGFTLRLTREQLMQAKQIVSQELGYDPELPKLDYILRMTMDELIAAQAKQESKKSLVITATFILSVMCIAFYFVSKSLSFVLATATLIALIIIVSYMDAGNKKSVFICVLILLMGCAGFWMAWDMDAEIVKDLKRSHILNYGTAKEKVAQLHLDMLEWNHEEAVRVYASIKPEEATDFLKNRINQDDSTWAGNGSLARVWYIPSYYMRKYMPVVIELFDMNHLSQQQYEELARDFLDRYPEASDAFGQSNEIEDIQLFLTVLEKCSDDFLQAYDKECNWKKEPPKEILDYLSQRIGSGS
jgi:hypothetical protein